MQLCEASSRQGQGAMHPLRDVGLVPTQALGSGGTRQMRSPVRDRGVSPANKLTDLQKQNDALRFKLQVQSIGA